MLIIASTPIDLLIVAAIVSGLSGIPLLFRLVPLVAGQMIATVASGIASTLGMIAALATLFGYSSPDHFMSWGLPYGDPLLRLDALAAIFVLVISLVSGACMLYARGYWAAERNPKTVRRLSFFFGLLTASLMMLVLSGNGVLFIFWWEIMSFAAYFCLITEDTKFEVREAGVLYLIVAHVSALALFALVALINKATGSFVFPASGVLIASSGIGTGIFAVALLAFGLKAGMMPLHIWLPSAHANAPSHVSAMLSGVVLKVGIYGLLRALSFFDSFPLWWGIVILAFGTVSGVVGVVFAIAQHDVKRLLAYHSIENIGIILMGIGVALVGQSVGNDTVVILGMSGALLHVVNHAIFKALLFLGAGSVIHAVGTRKIDIMGGLQRKMPWTAAFFLVGAVAICGLPPLNGFVSEFVIYLGLLRGISSENGLAAAVSGIAVPGLALVGGLAVACFVKVYGVVFLGEPRSLSATNGHESPRTMIFAMAILALFCGGIGLFPWMTTSLLQAAVESWRPVLVSSPYRLIALVPLGWVSGVAIILTFVIILALLVLRGVRARLPVAQAPTWGCGFVAPSARMQYTASSFGEMLVHLFRTMLRPHVKFAPLKTLFPKASHFESHVPETTLELIYVPVFQRIYIKTWFIRRLQHGYLQLYILYIFITLLVLLLIT